MHAEFERKEKVLKTFDGKVVLVTGGGSGIGAATAAMFAERGAAVMIMDQDAAAGAAMQEQLQATGVRCELVVGDVSDPAACRKAVAETVQRLGSLDVLVNNAGGGRLVATEELSDAEWRHMQGINSDGTFYMSREAVRVMAARSGGAIVNMASIYGMVGFASHAAYVAAKGAIISLTRALAIEFAPRNIRVNAVAPGMILTPLIHRNLTDEHRRYFMGLHPVGRLGRPEEVASVICFLASDDASFVTGACLPVDGGYTAQ